MGGLATGDVLVFGLAFCLIPVLVVVYIPPGSPLRRHLPLILPFAYVWLFFALFHVGLTELLFRIPQADAVSHTAAALRTAQLIEMGWWDLAYSGTRLGNSAFQLYLAVLYWLTGSNGMASVFVHVLFAFWGALLLARALTSEAERVSGPLALVLLFTPTVVFWSATNLKEGLMYWATCAVFSASSSPAGRRRWARVALLATGFLVGGLFRPHMMLVWGAAIFTAFSLSRGRKVQAALALAAIPFLLVALNRITGFGMTVSDAFEKLERQYHSISADRSGSDILYEGGRPVFLLSGLAALFLRPFPWEVRSLAQAVASAEVWAMTGALAFLWLTAGSSRRTLFASPSVRAAFAACVLFSIMFPWLGNEGLLVRQRIHAVAALLTLLAAPWFARRGPNPAGVRAELPGLVLETGPGGSRGTSSAVAVPRGAPSRSYCASRK